MRGRIGINGRPAGGLLKEEVGEVGIGGIGFELGVDGELQASGLLHGVLPLVEATAVGKEGEAALAQIQSFCEYRILNSPFLQNIPLQTRIFM